MSKWMTRILVIIFSWVQCASAFPQQDLSRFKSQLQETQWTKRPLKLKDLYAKAKDSWPLEYRFEVESILARNPNIELPKLEFRMIKNGLNEDVQLIAVKDRQAMSVVFSFRGDNVGTMTFTSDGKDVRKKISLHDFFNPARMMDDVPGAIPSYAAQIGFTRFLYSKEIALLRDQDRMKYGEQVREVMVLAEKAQKGLHKKREPSSRKKQSGKKTSSLQFLRLLIDQAQAQSANGGKCLIMGWVGSFKDGACVPPQAAEGSGECTGQYTCNSALYGPNICVRPVEREALTSASEFCNQRVNAKDTKYNFFKGIKDGAQFDARMKDLSLQVAALRLECKEAKGEQVKECADLEAYMDEISKVNCDVVAKAGEGFTDLRCSGKAQQVADAPSAGGSVRPSSPPPPRRAPVPSPRSAGNSAGPGAGIDGAGEDDFQVVEPDVASGESLPGSGGGVDGNMPPTRVEGRGANDPTPPPGPAASEVRCQNLPVNPSGLNCQGGQVMSLTCAVGGQTRLLYYCDCAGRSEVRTNTSLPTGCSGSVASSGLGGERYVPDPRYRKERPKASGVNMLQTFGSLAGIAMMGFMIWAQQQNQQQMYQQYYTMMQPQQLLLAPPPTSSGSLLNPYTGGNILTGTR